MCPYVPLSQCGCTFLVKIVILYDIQLIQVIHTHTYIYIHIHADTYTYIYIHILQDTYTYIHPAISVGREISGAAAAARDFNSRRYLPISSRTWLVIRSPSAKCACNAYCRHSGCTLDPLNACCARWCAKTGPRVGLLWPKKVVGHLPRDALSGARWSPPQQKGNWGSKGCRTEVVHICMYLYKYTNRYIQIHTDTYRYIVIHAHMHCP